MNKIKLPDPSLIDMTKTKTADAFAIRDPSVLVVDGCYYMYGTGAAGGPGYGCYVSTDLVNWAGPVRVFNPPAGFDATGCYWAPECHAYNGSFYLFATYLSGSTGHRGVSIFKSESPLGPFTEISDGHITPHDWDSIDGTLYVDEDGQPWMAFVHEWTSMPDEIGAMAIAKMSDDLSHFIEEPQQIFLANDAIWATDGVTDGPFLYKTSEGRLLMIWSNFSKKGYAVGIAHSDNGKIDGKWRQQLKPLFMRDDDLYPFDGGHGFIFTDLDGQLTMSLHSPNSTSVKHEEAAFIRLKDTGKTLILQSDAEAHSRALDAIKTAGERLFGLIMMIIQACVFPFNLF